MSPIGEAAVAMPAAMLFAARAALADFVARLYISLGDVEKRVGAINGRRRTKADYKYHTVRHVNYLETL